MNETTGTIPLETLIDLAEGRVSAERAQTLRQQLQTADEATRADWRWVQGFVTLSDKLTLPAPSDRVRENVLRALREKTKRPSLLRQITLALTFDSWQQPNAALAARSTAGGEPRALLFSSDEFDVSLELDANTVSGQILGGDDWFSVLLMQQGDTVAQTVSDEHGDFAIDNVPSGTYTLRLTDARREMTLIGLEV